MAEPATVNPHTSATASPCVCCREKPHVGVPDRDLKGYVCGECAALLRSAVRILKAAGFTKPPTDTTP